VLMVGGPDEVRADEKVRAAYLGSAEDPEETEDAAGDGAPVPATAGSHG
jgi:Branched-chain amino acid ATP-binding cassette transporter